MYYLLQINVNGSNAFAVKLRQQIAGLKGSATAFFFEGMGYTVIRPGVVQVKIDPATNSLPRVFSGMVVQVSVDDVVRSKANIAGNYSRGQATARVERLSGPASGQYAVTASAPTLRDARQLYEGIIAGRAGRHRKGRRG